MSSEAGWSRLSATEDEFANQNYGTNKAPLQETASKANSKQDSSRILIEPEQRENKK